jgi:ubiquinone/menaquinone biosynthesis C-methylase UbiE
MQSQKLYDKYKSGRHWDKHPISYAESFSNFLKNKSFRGLVVDIGCDGGRDVDIFSKQGFDVVGIDYSESEIKLARDRFPTYKFDVQNAEQLNFKDSSVGALFIINVIHYLNQEKAFKGFFRILQPGGYIFIHFNLEIKGVGEEIDYSQREADIKNLLGNFKIIKNDVIERKDEKPLPHTHKILELILEK